MIRPVHPDVKHVLSSAEQLMKFFMYDGYAHVQWPNDRWHSEGAQAVAQWRQKKPEILYTGVDVMNQGLKTVSLLTKSA